MQGVRDDRIAHAIMLHDMIEHGFKKKVGINTYNALIRVMTRYAPFCNGVLVAFLLPVSNLFL